MKGVIPTTPVKIEKTFIKTAGVKTEQRRPVRQNKASGHELVGGDLG